jgi:hypothetical protein
MDSKKIANKVRERLAAVKTAENGEWDFTSSVEIDGLSQLLFERLTDKLKKDWNMPKLERGDVDYNVEKEVSIKWSANFEGTKERFINMSLSCPNQKISISGLASAWDEKDKEVEFEFDEVFELKDVETDYKDVKISSDIAPKELEYYNKKWILKF